MYFYDRRVEEIIKMICLSKTPQIATSLYLLYKEVIGDYKIVISTDVGSQPGLAANLDFKSGAAIRGLSVPGPVLILDSEIVSKMMTGTVNILIDYSISLDTNALSYLIPHFSKQATSTIPDGYSEIFNFISRLQVNIDSTPYRMENLQNLANNKKVHKILETLEKFEILRNMDDKLWETRRVVRPNIDSQALSGLANKALEWMRSLLSSADFMAVVDNFYYNSYASLLKMAIIQLKSPRAQVSKKTLNFLDFSHTTLGDINKWVVAIARAYFKSAKTVQFFNQIQLNSSDIIGVLKRMAWDLFHVRFLQYVSSIKISKENIYFFPALLTFDLGLINIIDLCQPKAFIIKHSPFDYRYFYSNDPLDLIADEDPDGISVIESYYSQEAVSSRAINNERFQQSFKSIVKSLEDELLLIKK